MESVYHVSSSNTRAPFPPGVSRIPPPPPEFPWETARFSAPAPNLKNRLVPCGHKCFQPSPEKRRHTSQQRSCRLCPGAPPAFEAYRKGAGVSTGAPLFYSSRLPARALRPCRRRSGYPGWIASSRLETAAFAAQSAPPGRIPEARPSPVSSRGPAASSRRSAGGPADLQPPHKGPDLRPLRQKRLPVLGERRQVPLPQVFLHPLGPLRVRPPSSPASPNRSSAKG